MSLLTVSSKAYSKKLQKYTSNTRFNDAAAASTSNITKKTNKTKQNSQTKFY